MTQPGYDERFAMPVEASRRGAHRARPNPFLAVLPIVAVVVVVLAVVSLAYLLFGSSLGNRSTGSGGATVAAGETGAAGVTPTPGGTAGPTTTAQPGASAGAGTTPSAGPGTSASGTPSSLASSSAGAVDQTLVLNFYNGTSPVVSGLSRKAATKLVAAGWKQGSFATWTGPAVTQTTVYYAKASQKASAEAVVQALGVGVAKLSAARAGRGIVVVVFNDYLP